MGRGCVELVEKMKNRHILIISISLLIILIVTHKSGLFDNLKNFFMKRKTVSQVISNIETAVKEQLHIDNPEKFDSLTLIGIKEDRKLECWVKTAKNWKLLKTYDFAGYSGNLGPKLKAGDGQIPEGIYVELMKYKDG